MDEWNFNQHFQKPKNLGRNMWTHINYAEQFGDELVVTSAHPPDVPGKPEQSEVLLVKDQEIRWRLLDVADNLPLGAHCFKPLRGHFQFLISDSAGQRIMELDIKGKVRKLFNFKNLKPNMIDWAFINGRIYVIAPTSPVKDSGQKPQLLWIDWENQEVVSSVSEDVTHIFCARYLPEWSAELTEEEEEKVKERLRKLGYLD